MFPFVIAAIAFAAVYFSVLASSAVCSVCGKRVSRKSGCNFCKISMVEPNIEEPTAEQQKRAG